MRRAIASASTAQSRCGSTSSCPHRKPRSSVMLNKRSAAMTFIFITVLLDMLALGIIIPVFQPLIITFSHGNYANASIATGIFATIFALVQFFASPVLGTLSDRFGRRPIVLLSNLGTSFDYVILALAPNLFWLFIGRVVSGATTASITVASAYVADVTPADKRAGAYGMISAAFGIGFVVGPALGGFLGAHDPRLPFWVASALSMLNFFYGLFVLPESLDRAHRNPFSWKRANPLGSLKLLRRHSELSGLALVTQIGYVAHEALPQLFILYTMYAYGWTMKTIGVSLAVVGVVTIVVSGFVIQPVVNRLGERKALLAGLFLGGLGFVLYAGSEVVFWVAIVVNMMWMIGSSSSQAIMTRRVEKNEQGELQGAINMLRSVGMMIGPAIFTGFFAYSIGGAHAWKFPGLAWVVGGLMLFASVIVAARVTSPSDDVRETIDHAEALEAALPDEVPLVQS
ncbi:MAG TPA: TCR/Tet family MFS transporter [Candidatus Aquilonibacter sp.]|nr:TCR/Tet family MFS transporter [Candidatus Aquilonibacter sp.]